jgi:RNA polymerase sigma-70 factor (ECF subfamily)
VTGGISGDDREGLEGCYRARAPDLFGYASWITQGDEKLAQDLVHDAFVAAAGRWREMREWDAERQGRWLAGTVHNLAVTSFRRAGLDHRKREEVWERYRPRSADTHEEALTAMALARCWEVIRQMPARRHHVAVMRWGEGMSISEIACALGITEGAVSAHLAHARKRLLAEAGRDAPFDLRGREAGGHE